MRHSAGDIYCVEYLAIAWLIGNFSLDVSARLEVRGYAVCGTCLAFWTGVLVSHLTSTDWLLTGALCHMTAWLLQLSEGTRRQQ